MIKGDVRDDAGQRRDDIRGIQPPAKAGFPDHQITFLRGKKLQRHDRDKFEEGGTDILPVRNRLEACSTLESAYLFDESFYVSFRNQLAINLNPFAERNEVRRGEKSNAQSSRAIDAFEHGAG